MGRAPVSNGINRVGLYSSKARGSFHPGPAVMRASNHLAVVCLFLGVALAAFLSGSLEQRIGNLFSFGLLPAISFYVGGHVLGQLLVFGVELCDLCFRYAVHLMSGLLSWAGTRVSNLTEAPASSEASGIDNWRYFRSRAVEFTFRASNQMKVLAWLKPRISR
jgi:hypothetical protein